MLLFRIDIQGWAGKSGLALTSYRTRTVVSSETKILGETHGIYYNNLIMCAISECILPPNGEQKSRPPKKYFRGIFRLAIFDLMKYHNFTVFGTSKHYWVFFKVQGIDYDEVWGLWGVVGGRGGYFIMILLFLFMPKLWGAGGHWGSWCMVLLGEIDGEG